MCLILFIYLFIYFSSFFLLDFLVLIFPFSFWSLGSNIFFFFFQPVACLFFVYTKNEREEFFACLSFSLVNPKNFLFVFTSLYRHFHLFRFFFHFLFNFFFSFTFCFFFFFFFFFFFIVLSLFKTEDFSCGGIKKKCPVFLHTSIFIF